MIRAIIFDCFGVLVGSGFKDTFRQAGGDLSADERFVDDIMTATSTGHISVREMHEQVAERLGIDLNEWVRFVTTREQPNLELLGYIRLLKPHYKLAILSNANHDVLPRKLSPDQLALFDVTIASADVGYIKPNPEIYELTAERLGVKPSECVFIDDGPLYCQAAAALGMKAILYRDLDHCRHELEQFISVK